MPEFKRGTGYLPDFRRPDDGEYEMVMSASNLPDKYEPLKEAEYAFPQFTEDQFQTNSCVGQSVHYMGEYKVALARKQYVQLSPSWPYWYARLARGWTGQDQGSFIRDAMEACATRGICLNSWMPFRDANGNPDVFTAPSEAAKQQAARHRFVNARRIDRTQVLDALASGSGCVGGFTVFQHVWFGEEAQETGIVRTPRHHNDFGGGHAIFLCGYDKSRGTAHGPGSWGYTHWGVHSRYRAGWHEIDLDYIYQSELSSDFWTFDYLEGAA